MRTQEFEITLSDPYAPEALGAGYRSIPRYNANDLATVWYEKEL